jgi:CRP-like cAMP-binding protein
MNMMPFDELDSGLLYRNLFSEMPAATIEAFEAIQFRTRHPRGTTLFVEGQMASGIFILYAGSVKLSQSLGEEELVSSRIAGPGEILGVAPTISGDRYRAAAQTIERSQIGFIDRGDFLCFLCQHNAAAFQLVQLLGNDLTKTLERARITASIRSLPDRTTQQRLGLAKEETLNG